MKGDVTIRVRYAETDRMGLLHHANYLVYFEQARTELLRDQGLTYKDLEDQGFLLVLTQVEVRYRKPAYYDDLLTIRTTVERTTSVRIDHRYEVLRPQCRDALLGGPGARNERRDPSSAERSESCPERSDAGEGPGARYERRDPSSAERSESCTVQDSSTHTELVAEGSSTLACVDRTGRLQALPEMLRGEHKRSTSGSSGEKEEK